FSPSPYHDVERPAFDSIYGRQRNLVGREFSPREVVVAELTPLGRRILRTIKEWSRSDAGKHHGGGKPRGGEFATQGFGPRDDSGLRRVVGGKPGRRHLGEDRGDIED